MLFYFYIALITSILNSYLDINYHFPLSDTFNPDIFKERRSKIINSLGDNSAIMILSADYIGSEAISTYIEPNSYLYYLTGNIRQKSVLILTFNKIKTLKGNFNEILFIEKQSDIHRKWYETSPDIDFVENYLKIDAAFELKELENYIKSFVKIIDTFYIIYPSQKAEHYQSSNFFNFKKPIIDSITKWNSKTVIKNSFTPLKKMREIKDSFEISLIQKAVDITIEAFFKTFSKMPEINTEYQLQATIEYYIRNSGAEHTAYPSIIASGPNSCILHYSYNNRKFYSGELILIDCGAKYRGYSADLTRTIPVNGKFNEYQKILYSIVLEAQDSAITNCKPGKPFIAPHIKATEIISKRLLELGIIENSQDYRLYLPHSVSHYIGIDVHDVGTYGELRNGTIITIEPGIYIPPGSPCDNKWWNSCIRIEDMILITDDEPIVLSEKLPKTIDDIENLLSNLKR